MLLMVATMPFFGGCDSTGTDKPGIGGYWKGQMIEEVVLTDQGTSPAYTANERPRRILLKLEQSAGSVQGRFAQSSDLVAFRQIDGENSRRVSTFPVTGTLVPPRVRLSVSMEEGRTFELEGLVSKGVITGTYVTRYPADLSREAGSGKFKVERF
jgi:hypothetical protein